MANPARELAVLLEEWLDIPLDQNIYQLRGGGTGPGEVDFWRKQAHAAYLALEVDRFIESLDKTGKPVTYYQLNVVSWYRGVFAPDLNWAAITGQARESISESAVHLLYALADTMDANMAGAAMPTHLITTMSEALDELYDMLSENEAGLDEKTRRYVFELITSLRRVVNETDAFGSTDLLARINELFGFLTLLADDLSADPANDTLVKKLRVAARKIIPMVRFSTGFALGTLGGAADIAQITSVISPANGGAPA